MRGREREVGRLIQGHVSIGTVYSNVDSVPFLNVDCIYIPKIQVSYCRSDKANKSSS